MIDLTIDHMRSLRKKIMADDLDFIISEDTLRIRAFKWVKGNEGFTKDHRYSWEDLECLLAISFFFDIIIRDFKDFTESGERCMAEKAAPDAFAKAVEKRCGVNFSKQTPPPPMKPAQTVWEKKKEELKIMMESWQEAVREGNQCNIDDVCEDLEFLLEQ